MTFGRGLSISASMAHPRRLETLLSRSLTLWLPFVLLPLSFVLLPLSLAAAAANTTSAAAIGSPDTNLATCREMGLRKCPTPFDAVLPEPKDMLTWSQDQRVIGFRNTYRQYKGDVFHADPAHVYPLPAASAPLSSVHYSMDHRDFGLADYLQHQSVTGLLILKDGHIAYEHYARGNTDSSLWTSRSVAKSIVSVLVGVAIKEGRIRSVDADITEYLPELKQTAWDGVSLRNLLQHTSGVQWNENYADPKSDFAELTRCEASKEPYACVMKLVSSVKRKPGVKPGEVWSYNTGGAWLAGRVLEKATGTTLAHYLETRLWQRFGMESDGVWEALVPGKVDMGGHGFNATLRDWGRVGWFVAEGGRLPTGEALLPDDWLAQSTHWTRARGSVTPATPNGQYGYQWWHLGPPAGSSAAVEATAERTFWGEGIYGQALAVNPRAHLVMVQWSTYQEADGPDSLSDEQLLFFHAVEESLSGK
ncbi:MAG TPA: serine hydrolase [Steroidobacteraceae bacterium]|nr:serine hydrolase [Steroidobacteraceae bacterium]